MGLPINPNFGVLCEQMNVTYSIEKLGWSANRKEILVATTREYISKMNGAVKLFHRDWNNN